MTDEYKRYVHNIPAARDLRQRQTATELLLWERLRDRRLDGLKFRRQHAIGRCVVDFFCAAASLAVEIDGAIHDAPVVRDADRERQQALEADGVRFLRLSTEVVERDIEHALAQIAAAARDASGSPLPRSRERGWG